METQTIQWHERGYINWKDNLDKHEKRTLEEIEKIKQDRKRLDFYKFQIDEAKRVGKTSFDRERFRKQKGGLNSSQS